MLHASQKNIPEKKKKKSILPFRIFSYYPFCLFIIFFLFSGKLIIHISIVHVYFVLEEISYRFVKI